MKNEHANYDEIAGKNVTMGYDMGCDIGYGIRYQI
jgi:hypothetical protein